jgi:predicted amidohydrolase|nr:carbon-nitrogen hydrolase family protein [uncultured Lachnoclostridium sp.]
MTNKLRIAVVQANYPSSRCEENTKIGLQYVKQAKKMNADLVLFPECWLHGYQFPLLKDDLSISDMYDIDRFEETMDSIKNKKSYQEWMNQAIDENSEYVKQFCMAAKELNIGIVLTGYTKGNEKPRNSAMIIDKEGNLLMTYSKVHTCDFSLESLLESGDEFKVCDFHGIKLGVMICYDREYPESARMLMLKGAEIIVVPNSCGGMKPRVQALSTRAYENMTGVVMANTPFENGGNSCAFQPIAWDKDGKEQEMTLFIADATSEKIYIAEFDMDAIRDYRNSEMMGNTFRKVNAYAGFLDTIVEPPFVRNRWVEE